MSVHWLVEQWHAQMLVLATHSYRNLSQIKTIFDFAAIVEIHIQYTLTPFVTT
jgi:hypothetical protein